MKDEIKAAADLWRSRVALARDSFLANVGLNEAQSIQFDAVMGDMNKRLGEKIQKWADELKSADTASTETGVRMFSDLSSTLVQTYDELDQTMPSDWRQKSGDEFKVLDFIDPDVATPLVDVEDKLVPPGTGDEGVDEESGKAE